MVLFIKNMMSIRCRIVVQEEVEKLGLYCLNIQYGFVEILQNITTTQLLQLKKNLAETGLCLIENKKYILIELIKNTITEMINCESELPNINYSYYLSKNLNYDYTYLANIFSEELNITIQQYIINQKVLKVKELMLYDDMNITEISYKLNYSSVAHLSNQFKKVTGFSPSYYKQHTTLNSLCMENK